MFDDHFVRAMLNSVIFAVLAAVLLGGLVRAIDVFGFRKVDFQEEINKGNMAAAIVLGAIIGGLSLVIFGVTN